MSREERSSKSSNRLSRLFSRKQLPLLQRKPKKEEPTDQKLQDDNDPPDFSGLFRGPPPPVAVQQELAAALHREDGAEPDLEDTMAAFVYLATRNLPEPAEEIVTEQIDFHAVSKWLACCETDHLETCRDGGYNDPSSRDEPIVLIDVLCDCIVEATLNERFVALSYVWGGVEQLCLLSSNREELSKPGALSVPARRKLIPQTLHDAFAVVRKLGERYLWVDTLCFEQDKLNSSVWDPAASLRADAAEQYSVEARAKKTAMLAQMAAIYSQAVFTIVTCTAEDANCSLPGVRAGTRLSSRLDTSRLTDNDAKKLRRLHLDGLLECSPHASRAWTMQEVILSKRCLFFFGNQVYFRCLTSKWQEKWAIEESLELYPGRPSLRTSKWPPDDGFAMQEFALYAKLVQNFSKRDITLVNDRLHAMEGLWKALSAVWEWNFAYGLPWEKMHLAMMWCGLEFDQRDWSALDKMPVFQRADWGMRQMGSDAEAGARSWKATGRLACFPSWSWLSHPGASMYPMFIAGSTSMRGLVDWGAAMLWDGENVHLADGKGALDPSSPPTSLGDIDTVVQRLRACPPGTLCFHSTIALLPGPPSEDPGEGLPAPHESESTRWFAAQRALFRAAGKPYTALVNARGEWYGTVVGASEERLQELQQSGTKLAFVLLSTSPLGWVLDSMMSHAPYDAALFPGGNWATLNVLLVARGKHADTRLAVGEVHEDAWAALETEEGMVYLA